MSFETATANMQQAMNTNGTSGPGSPPIQMPQQGQQTQQNQSQSNSNVDPVTGQSMNQSQRAQADQKAVQEIMDLDGLEKFKFQGKEWTPEEIQKSIMMEKDYRKKTAEVAREREYTANLRADLAKVKRDPALADEFRKLYPENYHQYLDLVLEQAAAQEVKDNSTSQSMSESPALAKQLSELQKQFEQYKQGLGEKEHAAKVVGIQQELDQLFKGFEKKYDFAVEEAVLTKAEALISQGYQMTNAAWEKLWKSSHEQNQAKAQKWYESKTQEQLKANQEGGDIARGGGTPTAGRKKMSLSDVSDHMLASLQKG